MLVIDLADHGLHQVLEGDEPIRAAELVDHQGHVCPGGLHPQQKVCSPHGRRHIEGFALEAHEAGVRGPAPPGLGPGACGHLLEDILDVDDAQRVVEGLPVDRHAGVLGVQEAGDHLVE